MSTWNKTDEFQMKIAEYQNDKACFFPARNGALILFLFVVIFDRAMKFPVDSLIFDR